MEYKITLYITFSHLIPMSSFLNTLSGSIKRKRSENAVLTIAQIKRTFPVYQVTGYLKGQFFGIDVKCNRFILVNKKETLVMIHPGHEESTLDPFFEEQEIDSGDTAIPNKRHKPLPVPDKRVDYMSLLSEIALFAGDSYFSLPTESPIIEYTLQVRQRPCSQSFEILKIVNAKPRFGSISKEFIVDYYTTIFTLQHSQQFQTCMRYLPSQNITIKDIETYVDEPIWANRFKKLVQIAHKPQQFFDLLKYFSSTVLCKLTAGQLRYVKDLLHTQPYVFCFRTLLEKMLQFPGAPFPKRDGAQRWKVVSQYALARPDLMYTDRMSFKDLLTWWCPRNDELSIVVESEEFTPSYFNPRHPLLPFHLLVSDFDSSHWPLQFDMVFFKMAMSVYLELEGKRYKTGSSIIRLPDIKSQVKEILIDQLGILVEPETDHYMLEEDYYLEQLFALVYTAFVEETECYESEWYNRAYCRQLAEWIKKRPELKNAAFYTHSYSWGRYLSTHSQLDFSCLVRHSLPLHERAKIQLLAENRRKKMTATNQNNTSPVHYIVMEHVHKFSTENFLCLLLDAIAFLVENHGATHEQIRLKLVLIGDPEDLPVYHMIGQGNLWKGLSDAFPVKKLNFAPGVSKDMLKLKSSLNDQVSKGIRIVSKELMTSLSKEILALKRTLNNPKKTNLRETVEKEDNPEIENMSAKAITASKRKTNQILCSGKAEQRVLSDVLSESRTGKYDENTLSVGNRVGVLETGSEGIIKKTPRLEPDLSKTFLGKSTSAELHFGTYKCQICPCALSARCSCNNYYTSTNFTIYQNCVDMVQRRQGIPTNYVIFYVSANTYRSHLLSALKYCFDSFHIFVLLETPFTNIYKKEMIKETPRKTTLASAFEIERRKKY